MNRVKINFGNPNGSSNKPDYTFTSDELSNIKTTQDRINKEREEKQRKWQEDKEAREARRRKFEGIKGTGPVPIVIGVIYSISR